MTPRRVATLAALAAVLTPWVVLSGDAFVFAWGLVSLDSLHVVFLSDYLRLAGGAAGLPRHLLAWPVALGCWAAGAGVAALGPRGDHRVAAGLFALAALNVAWLAAGLARAGALTVPSGAVALAVAAVATWTARAGVGIVASGD